MGHKLPKYINRELSWLEFNQRVLDEATDEDNPLLERLKFLAITSSNLDEFFMVRVGGLQLLNQQGRTKRDPAGMRPRQQLDAVSQRTHQMTRDQYACFLERLEPRLAKSGIKRLTPSGLSGRQRKVAQRFFDEEVFAVYTPMAVYSPDDFPMVGNRTLNVCVRLAPVEEGQEPRFALIPFGPSANRFLTLPSDGGYEYILLEDVVLLFIDRFFPDQRVLEVAPFRVTRNADLGVREDMASDLLEEMADVLEARKESDCVRLEIGEETSPAMLDFLRQSLGVTDEDCIYRVPGPLDLSAFMRLTGLEGFAKLKYESWLPRRSPDIDPKAPMFDVIRGKDQLLCRPFESFEPVVRLVEEAADDPDVLAMKIILYRTSRNSPIVAALRRAAEQGKRVTALLELKARFDEARNIEWAKNLEQAGVQVIYGVKNLKTHAKVCIVIRREPQGIQRYVHFSTGNYNEVTARLYTDCCFLTCDEDLAADATSFFNAITGYSQPTQLRKLAAAPISIRDRLLELIAAETERKKQGQPAHIMAQINSLADPTITDALYQASQAGVQIDLNVRGVCCLRPGVPGLSENIRVLSILDRYLEHCRILYFYHGGDELVFLSSADWMSRNLDRRVELLIPIEDPPSRRRLIDIIRSYSKDNVKGRLLQSDGTYQRLHPDSPGAGHRHQEHLYDLARRAEQRLEQSQRTVFEPYRAPDKTE